MADRLDISRQTTDKQANETQILQSNTPILQPFSLVKTGPVQKVEKRSSKIPPTITLEPVRGYSGRRKWCQKKRNFPVHTGQKRTGRNLLFLKLFRNCLSHKNGPHQKILHGSLKNTLSNRPKGGVAFCVRLLVDRLTQTQNIRTQYFGGEKLPLGQMIKTSDYYTKSVWGKKDIYFMIGFVRGATTARGQGCTLVVFRILMQKVPGSILSPSLQVAQ